MEWNKEQLEAIDSRGENLLVSAAAGSGKTAVLTARVLKLLEEGTPLDRMLIITFTNAAAAEMKQRIAKDAKLSVLDRYNICTFDKFAIEVCKNYYHVIGIPPDLKICDNYKAEIYTSEALDEMFEELFEADDAEFKDFLTHYCSPRNNDAARDMIRALYTFIQSMPDPEEWLERIESSAFDPAQIIAEAAKDAQADVELGLGFFEDAAKLLGASDEGGKPLTPALAEKNAIDISNLQQVLDLFSGGYTEEALSALSGLPKFQTMAALKVEKEAYEAVKEETSALREKGKDIIKAARLRTAGISTEALEKERRLMQPYVKALCRLTRDFAARYGAKKLKAGLMDFSDAEHYALRILRDPQVSGELKKEYKYIFVDEYQDSNYVQEELVKCISSGDNVFMVGDIKQSIYKFRLAEPEIFLEKYRTFRTGQVPRSRVIDLNSNYRSKPVVIDQINKVFERVMTQSTAGIDYDENAALRAGTDYDGPYSYPPELILLATRPDPEDDDAAGEEIEEIRAEEAEAKNAVRVINKYHGKTVKIKDEERQLRYSDMAILLRAAKNRGEVYYQTLLDNGIPVFLERNEGYFDTPEIRVFLDLLRVIDDPRQDLALISVMHFPSFGFTAADLAEIKIQGRKLTNSSAYYDAVKAFAGLADGVQLQIGQAEDPLRARTADFLNKLASWRRKGACIPLADFVWQLMHESGIATYAQALSGGAQRIANLRAMADKAAAYESETSGGIGGFISYIELIAKSGKVDTGQVKLLTEADDVVRIMTVHKSKGLEFPFVLLAGMAQKLGGSRDYLPMRRHRDLGLALRLSDPVRGIKAVPASYRVIDSVLGAESYAEDIRVLYVAMTRARDILVMSAAMKDPKSLMTKGFAVKPGRALMKDYVSMVMPAMPASQISFVDYDELIAETAQKDAHIEMLRGIERGFDVDEAELPVSLEELKERLAFTYEPSPQSLLKKKYSVSEIAEQKRSRAEEKPSAPAAGKGPASAPAKSGLTGAQKGTAYHSVMEHMPFTEEYSAPEKVAELIEKLRQKFILSDEEAQAVEPQRVAAFLSSDIGRRAMAASELCKETPFVMKTELDGRQVLVQGVIDCYFREGGEYVLVDYKSNYVDRNDPEGSASHLRENYRPQLELYKEALEGITGVPVKESVLYLFGLNDSVAIE